LAERENLLFMHWLPETDLFVLVGGGFFLLCFVFISLFPPQEKVKVNVNHHQSCAL